MLKSNQFVLIAYTSFSHIFPYPKENLKHFLKARKENICIQY